jgi:predicted amidohydrolase
MDPGLRRDDENEESMNFKIACIQLTSGADMAANIAKIEAMVREASKRGAQLVALPENAFLMEEPGTKRALYGMQEHPAIVAAAHMAKVNHVWLLVGSVAVKIDDSGKTVNRSLLFGDSGQLVKLYDKIHLFDVDVGDGQAYKESARMLAGGQAVVATTPWAKIGMTVCYDVRFPQLYRALAKAGAEILAVPSAFTQVTGEAHWHALLRARAIENGCFVIAPAQTGMHPGHRKTFGHALIVDPWGKVLADAGVEEGIITTDIDTQQVKQVRARIPSLEHDREFE